MAARSDGSPLRPRASAWHRRCARASSPTTEYSISNWVRGCLALRVLCCCAHTNSANKRRPNTESHSNRLFARRKRSTPKARRHCHEAAARSRRRAASNARLAHPGHALTGAARPQRLHAMTTAAHPLLRAAVQPALPNVLDSPTHTPTPWRPPTTPRHVSAPPRCTSPASGMDPLSHRSPTIPPYAPEQSAFNHMLYARCQTLAHSPARPVARRPTDRSTARRSLARQPARQPARPLARSPARSLARPPARPLAHSLAAVRRRLPRHDDPLGCSPALLGSAHTWRTRPPRSPATHVSL